MIIFNSPGDVHMLFSNVTSAWPFSCGAYFKHKQFLSNKVSTYSSMWGKSVLLHSRVQSVQTRRVLLTVPPLQAHGVFFCYSYTIVPPSQKNFWGKMLIQLTPESLALLYWCFPARKLGRVHLAVDCCFCIMLSYRYTLPWLIEAHSIQICKNKFFRIKEVLLC